MFNIQNMDLKQLDFFKELENIGASHAATSLSLLLGKPVSLKMPRAQLCEYKNICDILNGPENLVTGLLVAFSGDIGGFILLVQNFPDALDLTKLAMAAMEIEETSKAGVFSDMQRSTLSEIANILIGSYITALSSLTGLDIHCSVPELVIDMAGAVMNLPAVAFGNEGDIALFLETEFENRDIQISGHFFLIPDAFSYQLLMKKMGLF